MDWGGARWVSCYEVKLFSEKGLFFMQIVGDVDIRSICLAFKWTDVSSSSCRRKPRQPRHNIMPCYSWPEVATGECSFRRFPCLAKLKECAQFFSFLHRCQRNMSPRCRADSHELTSSTYNRQASIASPSTCNEARPAAGNTRQGPIHVLTSVFRLPRLLTRANITYYPTSNFGSAPLLLGARILVRLACTRSRRRGVAPPSR